MVSTQEFEKALKKKPVSLNEKLISMIMEFIGYDEFNKENVVAKFISLIPDYDLPNEERVKASLLKKLKTKNENLNSLKEINKVKDIDQTFKEIGVELTQEEIDYLLILMYRKTKTISNLDIKVVAKYLLELNSETTKIANEPEEINIDEEKIIEIAQNFFLKIAKKLRLQGMSLVDIYGDKIEKANIEGKDVDILTPDAFLNGLKALGLEITDSVEYACVIKILAVNDDEKLLKFEYLVEIINDYGVGTEVKESSIDLQNIDDISLIIILALSENLIKEKISLHDLLQDKIVNKENNEVITSKDFFEIVEVIGVALEDKEHNKLKELLCLDASNKDLISFFKLNQVIEEFLRNEKLQEKAIKCYEEMIKSCEEAADP